MKPETLQTVIAVVLAALGGGGIAALLRVGSRNRLDEATARQSDANSAVALAGAYAKLIDQLEHRIKMLETENLELRARVLHLEERVNGRESPT